MLPAMFAGWETFYTLLGEASAALIGLLFVVATLTSTVDRERRTRGQSLFLTPVVFKFGSVLALSAVALAPGLPHGASRWLAAVVGLVGVANLGGVSTALLRGKLSSPLHWSDPWCYGLVPTLVFAAIAACPVLLDPADAGRAVGAATAALLLLAVRNAWDLVTTLAGQAVEARADSTTPGGGAG